MPKAMTLPGLRRAMVRARKRAGLTRTETAAAITEATGHVVVDSMIAAWEDRVDPPRWVVAFYQRRFGYLVDPLRPAEGVGASPADSVRTHLSPAAMRSAAATARMTAHDIAVWVGLDTSQIETILRSNANAVAVPRGWVKAFAAALYVPPIKLAPELATRPANPTPGALAAAAKNAERSQPPYTLKQLAFDTNMSPGEVRQALAGQPLEPDHLVRIAEALRVSGTTRQQGMAAAEPTPTTEPTRAELEDLIAQGCKIREIRARLGIPQRAVQELLSRHNLKIPTGRRTGVKYTREELKPLLDQGLTPAQIAQRLGTSTRSVSWWLRHHGLIGVAGQAAGTLGITGPWLQEQFDEGISISELAKRLGCTRAAIYQHLKKHGIDPPATRQKRAA